MLIGRNKARVDLLFFLTKNKMKRMEIHDKSLKIKFLFAVLLGERWKTYIGEAGSRFK